MCIPGHGELLPLFSRPCMASNVSVQYNGGFLPDFRLLTQCYYNTIEKTHLNAMKSFVPTSNVPT